MTPIPPLDELLHMLNTVQALLTQAHTDTVLTFGEHAAPRFPLERARNDVARAIRFIHTRTDKEPKP